MTYLILNYSIKLISQDVVLQITRTLKCKYVSYLYFVIVVYKYKLIYNTISRTGLIRKKHIITVRNIKV